MGRWQVLSQIHAVIQQTKHVNGLLGCWPEHHKMAAFFAMPRHMQSAHAGANVFTHLDTQDIRTIMQSFYGQRQGLGIHLSLANAKVVDGPACDAE